MKEYPTRKLQKTQDEPVIPVVCETANRFLLIAVTFCICRNFTRKHTTQREFICHTFRVVFRNFATKFALSCLPKSVRRSCVLLHMT